jgi:hypothetical protein
MRRGFREVVACLFLLAVVCVGGCDSKKSQTPDKTVDLPSDLKKNGPGNKGPNKTAD